MPPVAASRSRSLIRSAFYRADLFMILDYMLVQITVIGNLNGSINIYVCTDYYPITIC